MARAFVCLRDLSDMQNNVISACADMAAEMCPMVVQQNRLGRIIKDADTLIKGYDDPF